MSDRGGDYLHRGVSTIMEDQMRMEIPYAEIAETLKTALNLRGGSPVAVKLAKNPDGIPRRGGRADRGDGSSLPDDQQGAVGRRDLLRDRRQTRLHGGGAWALGLKELTPSLRTGEFYYKLGKFESWAACMRTIQQVPHVPELETYATVYAPLEKTPFDPHVVVVVAEPPGGDAETRADDALSAWRADRVHDVGGDPVGLCGCDRAALSLR